MQLSQLTVSLELAKQLKEAGYSQESLFTWKVGIDSGHPNLVITNGAGFDRTNRFFHFYAAPTAAELGEQLPIGYDIFKVKNRLWNLTKIPGHNYFTPFGETEAEIRAKIWLYLKKHQLLQGENATKQ